MTMVFIGLRSFFDLVWMVYYLGSKTGYFFNGQALIQLFHFEIIGEFELFSVLDQPQDHSLSGKIE